MAFSFQVAVKIINVSEITDHYVKKNLKREASIMSKISHPNIVYLFETIEVSNDLIFTLLSLFEVSRSLNSSPPFPKILCTEFTAERVITMHPPGKTK